MYSHLPFTLPHSCPTLRHPLLRPQVLVLLDCTHSADMLEEGVAREVVNKVQKLRKKVGSPTSHFLHPPLHPPFISFHSPLPSHSPSHPPSYMHVTMTPLFNHTPPLSSPSSPPPSPSLPSPPSLPPRPAPPHPLPSLSSLPPPGWSQAH